MILSNNLPKLLLFVNTTLTQRSIYASIACFALTIYALYTMGLSTSGYKTAFIFTIVKIVFTIISVFLSAGFLQSLVSLIISLANFMVMFYILNSTKELLYGIDNDLAKRADLLWKIVLVCLVVTFVCGILMFIPIINIFAAVILFVVAIVQFVYTILFLIFLWKSQVIFQN